MDLSLVFSDTCTLDDLIVLHDKKNISVVIADGKVASVVYGG